MPQNELAMEELVERLKREAGSKDLSDAISVVVRRSMLAQKELASMSRVAPRMLDRPVTH